MNKVYLTSTSEKPKSISLFFNKGQVFFNILSDLTTGGSVVTNVIRIDDVKKEKIVEKITDLLSYQNKKITMSDADWENFRKNDPVLTALNEKSWLKLAKNTAAYGLLFYPNNVELYLHTLDKKGRFALNHESRKKNFPSNTSIEHLVDEILLEVQQFPHVLSNG